MTVYRCYIAMDGYVVVPSYGKNHKCRRQMSKIHAELEYFQTLQFFALIAICLERLRCHEPWALCIYNSGHHKELRTDNS